MRELWNDGRGELLLWAVPVYVGVIALIWAVAARRSSRAWEALIVLGAISLVASLIVLRPGDGDLALLAYAALAGVALGLLLAPPVLDHVRGR